MNRTKGAKKKSVADQVKESANLLIEEDNEDLTPRLPTGSVMLNLACADNSSYGYGKGKIVNVIGDSEAGKTLLCLSQEAEVAHDSKFNEYNLHFDDVEHANEFDIKRMFGVKTARRIQYHTSDDVDQLLHNLFTICEEGKPFIYILDSFDALKGVQEEEDVKKKLDKRMKGEKTAGTYGDGKPKAASMMLRLIKKKIKNTGSLLLIISQTRDNISAISFATKTRSGGRALTFYCTHIMWLAKIESIIKKVRGLTYDVGSKVKVKVTKNKITGKHRTVSFDVYPHYGIDNIGSCIDYLLQTKYWKKGDSKINTKNRFGNDKTKTDLVKYIEENKHQKILYNLVEKVWLEIEEILKIDRPGKFN